MHVMHDLHSLQRHKLLYIQDPAHFVKVRHAGGEIVWSVDLLQVAKPPGAIITSPAFTACCPATPALSATLQWCASGTDVLQQQAETIESSSLCIVLVCLRDRRLALCCGDGSGDAVSVHLDSLAAAADKSTSIFADFTLSVELPTQSSTIRASTAGT